MPLPLAVYVLWSLLATVLCLPADAAVPGVNATHVVIGQTAPFSGLAAEYGMRLAAGLRVAYEETNAAGGVRGRNMSLLSLDDGYTADLAAANLPTLANQTLLLASVCGSAINTRLLPTIVADGVPNVGPWTGAAVTRFPFHEEIVNVRASYTDEMVVQAILLVERLRVHRVACFYQNDAFGRTALEGISAALSHVGLQLMVSASYPSNTLDIEAAVEAIAGYPQPVQAVVMASLEAQNVKFLTLFRQDNRTDPNCTFLFISTGVTSMFASKVSQQWWPNLYFTHVVPPLDQPHLPILNQFMHASDRYLPPGLAPDHLVLEGYLNGRLIAEVLRGVPGDLTRAAFLEELYNTRLYAVGGLLLGLYSRNFTGCEQVVCASSIGLRAIFPATLHPATGAMHYDAALGHFTYPITELSFPITQIVRPLLFGQLLPLDDPIWRNVSESIGRALQAAFAALNAAGGVDGRPVQLVQRYYTGDPAPAAAALADRFALLAFVGSVVERSDALTAAAPAQVGTYQTGRPATGDPFSATQVLVQASLPLEVMALAAFAQQLGQPVHLRAPNTPDGEATLLVMVKSLHTLQLQPASTRSYVVATDALQGISTGTVIAVGSDADVQAWFQALAALPQLRLLVPSTQRTHLVGSVDTHRFPQASRLHYPTMFPPSSPAPAVGATEAALYGRLLGGLMAATLPTMGNSSLAYSTTPQLLAAFYGKQFQVAGVTLGPYYAATCTAARTTDCECNQGVRQVTVLSAAQQPEPFAFSYTLPGCAVEYEDLAPAPAAGQWYPWVVGGAGGAVLLGILSWALVRCGQRDNAAAPKNAGEPFCMVFTDIEASTHLWAAIPDVMTGAMHAHHALIRRLLAKYRVYEVKTIGDSFMCAARTPASAAQFAVALQREFFAYDWGTDAIDRAYLALQEGGAAWGGAHKAWNGPRVRVGLHYGMGEILLDPVSRGYDYYGTVVNTAARVEAACNGGQIGVTQAVYEALRGQVPGARLTDLGAQPLRGLAEPVHLYQLVPMELSDRTFPPLRLDRAAAVVEVPSPAHACDGLSASSTSSRVPLMQRCASYIIGPEPAGDGAWPPQIVVPAANPLSPDSLLGAAPWTTSPQARSPRPRSPSHRIEVTARDAPAAEGGAAAAHAERLEWDIDTDLGLSLRGCGGEDNDPPVSSPLEPAPLRHNPPQSCLTIMVSQPPSYLDVAALHAAGGDDPHNPANLSVGRLSPMRFRSDCA
eukprot:EG_transcript_903